jgi:hypothetical protein
MENFKRILIKDYIEIKFEINLAFFVKSFLYLKLLKIKMLVNNFL